MKKILVGCLLFFVYNFYGQTPIKNMENVKYNYVKTAPFVLYDVKRKDQDHLKYFKATDAKTSILVLYGLSKDSIQIASGGKVMKELRLDPGSGSTGIRSMQPISNQKSLEIIFFRKNGSEKVTLTADDLKKYKYVYLSPRELPLQVEFTNLWKLFM